MIIWSKGAKKEWWYQDERWTKHGREREGIRGEVIWFERDKEICSEWDARNVLFCDK